MKLTWLGHSCFAVESGGYRVVLDPYYVSGSNWKKPRKPLFARLSGSLLIVRDAVMALKSGFEQGVQCFSKFSLLVRV